MKAIIQMTENYLDLPILSMGRASYAMDVAEQHGYKHYSALDFDNIAGITERLPLGFRFNSLIVKDNKLFQFEQWTGNFPFDGIKIREVGSIEK